MQLAKRNVMIGAVVLAAALGAAAFQGVGGSGATVTSGGALQVMPTESNGTALATNNDRLITVSDGVNTGGSTTDLRIDGWGDGVSTNYSSALTSAQLAAYNGNSEFDRLRSTTADGSSKTGELEAAPVENYLHIASAATTPVKATAGVLHKITVNTSAAGTVTVFDYPSGTCTGSPSGNVVAVITLAASQAPETLTYDAHMANGICVETSAAVDLTVSYE